MLEKKHKIKKVKICPRIPIETYDNLKKMGKKHGLSQTQLVLRAFNREIKILEQMEPII